MSRNNSRDSRFYTDWFEFAESDIAASTLLMKSKKTFPLAAFHCQQAIEKTFKGYFLYLSGYAPDGHNLIFLCKKASAKNPQFRRWYNDCIELNNYYIQTRYPPDFPLSFTRKKLSGLCQTAKSIYRVTVADVAERAGMASDTDTEEDYPKTAESDTVE